MPALIRLCIKGDAQDASRAAAKFGVPLSETFAGGFNSTYADTDAAALPSVVKWYLSTLGDSAPFDFGTLLFYSQGETK
jgi:hypothetical protein